jgi:hypothetical protein
MFKTQLIIAFPSPCHSSNISHLAYAKYYWCNGIMVWAGYHYSTFQKLHFTLVFLSQNDHPGKIVGQDQEF